MPTDTGDGENRSTQTEDDDALDIFSIVAGNGYRKECQKNVFVNRVTYHDERLLRCYNRYGYGIFQRTLFQAFLLRIHHGGSKQPTEDHGSSSILTRVKDFIRTGFLPDDNFGEGQLSPFSFAIVHGYYRIVTLIRDYYQSYSKSNLIPPPPSSSSSYSSSSSSLITQPLPYSSINDIRFFYMNAIDTSDNAEDYRCHLHIGTNQFSIGIHNDHIQTFHQLLYLNPFVSDTTKTTFEAPFVRSKLWDTDIPRTWTYFPCILGFSSTANLFQSVQKHQYYPRHYSFLAEIAGFAGNLSILQYCKDQNILINKYVSYYAAFNNQWSVIHWLRKEYDNDIFDEWTSAYAALGGHLLLLKELLYPSDSTVPSCPKDCDVINWASYGGHLDIVRYLHEETDTDWEEMTGYGACASGNIALLDYLFIQCNPPCPSHEYTYYAAGKHNQLAVIEWLRKNNFPWNRSVVLACIQHNRLPILQYLYQQDTNLFDEMVDLYGKTIEAGHLNIFLWLCSMESISIGPNEVYLLAVSLSDRHAPMFEYFVSQDYMDPQYFNRKTVMLSKCTSKPFLARVDSFCPLSLDSLSPLEIHELTHKFRNTWCSNGYLRLLDNYVLRNLSLDSLLALLITTCNHLDKIEYIHKHVPTIGQIFDARDQKTLVTSVIEKGNLAVLQYLVQVCKLSLLPVYKEVYYNTSICVGSRDVLEWLFEQYGEKKSSSIDYFINLELEGYGNNNGIENDNLPFYKYIAEKYGIRFRQSVLYMCCTNGYFSFLKWLLTDGVLVYPLDNSSLEICLNLTAGNGHLHLLKYLMERTSSISLSMESMEFVLSAAVSHSNKDIVKYLRSISPPFPWESSMATACASSNGLSLLKWMREEGCPWTSDVIHEAVQNDSVVMLKWLLSQGLPEIKNLCKVSLSRTMRTYVTDNCCFCTTCLNKKLRR